MLRVRFLEIITDFQSVGRTPRQGCHVGDIMREGTLETLYRDLKSSKSMAQRTASASLGDSCPAATRKKVCARVR